MATDPVSDHSQTVRRADGSIIEWSLSGVDAGADRSQAMILIAQGSGCAPARTNPNIALLAALLPEYAVLTVEKYGVSPTDQPVDPFSDCSDDYFKHHTVSQRVSDVEAVLNALRTKQRWNGPLVFFGGSEGGAVVSILSHRVDNADAAVVFSTATGLTMAEFFPMIVPPPAAREMQTVFEQVRANPMAEGVIGGNSFRWWSDILDRRLSDDLLQSHIPILIVHGENDRAAPIAAAQATRDAFIAAGQAERLSYWQLPDRDHHMVDRAGQSHMEAVLAEVAEWIMAH